MNARDYIQFDGIGLADLIAKGDVVPREVCEAALEVHAATDPVMSAVIETWPEDIEAAIAAADTKGAFRGGAFSSRISFLRWRVRSARIAAVSAKAMWPPPILH